MKRILFYIVLWLIPTMALADVNHLPKRTIENVAENSYIDSIKYDIGLFDIDDSLLSVHCPDIMIKPERMITRENELFIHSSELAYTPYNSNKSNYLIIIDYALYDTLRFEIKRYAEDVHTIYGYGVYVESVINSNPQNVKDLIISYQNNLIGVLLVGDVGEAYFEIDNDHNKYGYKKWPCDVYFMDLNGTWSDTDNNGIYDKHIGWVGAEIFVARLLGKGAQLGSESLLIRNQLQKSHEYWWKSSFHTADTILNYVDHDWIGSFSSSSIEPVLPSGIVEDVRYGIDTIFSSSDYLHRINRTHYGFTFLACHGDVIGHAFTNGIIYVPQIKWNLSNSYVYNLYCCSACNWCPSMNIGYLGGAYLFNNGKTMAVVGSTKIGGMQFFPNYFYEYFPTKNVGEAFLSWWQRVFGNGIANYYIWWNYGMVILGDPTIKLHYDVHDMCEENLYLNSYPSDNQSNLIMFKAGNIINVSKDFIIPNGVHVIFDAPKVIFENGFCCPIGASFETRSEGCEL